jgi:hypothetical protein
MIHLISRNDFPPLGWDFYQPETTWRNPDPMIGGFDDNVKKIIKMRKNNLAFALATDYESVSWELDNFTCHRLKNNPKWVGGGNFTPPPPVQNVNRNKTCGACP